MKYGKHTDSWYVNKALKFANETVKRPNISQSTYDKGYFAVESERTTTDEERYWTASQWWTDHAGEFFPIIEAENDDSDEYWEAVTFTQHVDTLIWKAFPNRHNFTGAGKDAFLRKHK